jgi:hypothetical protein
MKEIASNIHLMNTFNNFDEKMKDDYLLVIQTVNEKVPCITEEECAIKSLLE